MTQTENVKRKRGRPPKTANNDFRDTRQELIKVGLSVLTERGYSYTGIDEILRKAGVPKGSFYHYFDNKESFGRILIEAYGRYFAGKLDRWFQDRTLTPLQRLDAFVEDAKAGMKRFEYRRGCLIGNLGQEMTALPEGFRALLQDVFRDWERRTEELLAEAQEAGEISPDVQCEQMSHFFWIGWEGAVLRAKLDQSPKPLDRFAEGFRSLLRGV
ncbi:TetR/AcrR family transcriptional regulator [Marinobacter sp. F3R08]|uniref:acrylate utilization transcriptional regulator AcuR n=1 Tax=Marinobacter sp. F3R08 TaxID=2841559 RepID=UPI001C09E360|nr:TetR/AcrR family transcriptional regulator [Marinobacter sp. F3R08]MBU2953415.1 TetR/AcrR family transcriptional regulator [Marinobacter sp. F3R08]